MKTITGIGQRGDYSWMVVIVQSESWANTRDLARERVGWWGAEYVGFFYGARDRQDDFANPTDIIDERN
ncbi:hypothetical protein [Embleya hyalina]|uniref:Uncharacterized protein n=1 Tax=Embleya hyalina TaxID=516124 RepID=A0A401YZ34_9ACTN|nr:hypothetical protein [Embleya hyalina]GCD99886.1 hypothetical protein EHYA_07608 [Embleya hyalina]